MVKKNQEDFSQPTTEETATTDPSSYDPKRGEGKFTTVELGAALEIKLWLPKGEEVAGVNAPLVTKLPMKN